jgi:predicted GH43/DUF377 family glycosyl hydrolase
MKALAILLLILLSILSFSCSDQSNPINNKDSGKILLKIDRANAPSSVTLITATLSREGYSNITSTLNLLSDSTADLLMDNIPAGNWHLKVDAMNDSMVLLYTGETEVNVLAGFVTNINLNLIPTGQGTGSIYIYVTWGGTNINYQWIDNPTNPVLQSSGNYFDNYGVAQPVIMYDENKYKMWYHGDGGNAKKYVLYAESSDGKNWVKHPVPVLTPGAAGSWDSWAVQPGIVIKESGVYKMYFTGYANQNHQWYIGLATSTDGINWTKNPNPVLYSGSGWEYQITAASMIKKGNQYFLYYNGRNSNYTEKVGLAISNDGVNFTKHSANPIFINDKPWEGSGVMCPSIYQENNIYKMVYMSAQGTGFGIAQSSDGINWTKDPQNPFFRKEQTTNGWGIANIAYPNVIKVNNDFRIYYSGAANFYNPYYKIGFLKRTN